MPWHEASMFVPPNRWFHQHFNVSKIPSRYLALSPMRQARPSETVEDQMRDQIEYVDEAPWIRERFETELAKRGIESLMPDGAYTDRDYKWGYAEGEETGAQLFLGDKAPVA